MAMSIDDRPGPLYRDIFNDMLDIVVSDVTHFKRTGEPGEDDGPLALGRSLRLVCPRGDLKLRPYLSPFLELSSSQQAAKLLRDGFPNQMSVRCLTMVGGVRVVYLSTLLQTLLKAGVVLKGIVFDYRNSSRSLLSKLSQNHSPPTYVDVAAVVCGSRPLDPAKTKTYSYTLDCGRMWDLRRLALHGVYLWEIAASFPRVEVLVMRWLVTTDTVHRMDFLRFSDFKKVQHLILLHSLPEDEYVGPGVPLTLLEKSRVAQAYPGVTITEVELSLPTQEIPGWFADRVRDDTIWDVQGVNW